MLKPEVVVITEPTNLGVYRGHRGRMEMEVRTQGLSCHGSAPGARRQRRLQDGADRRRHRAAERAADGGRRPVPRQGLGRRSPRSAPRRPRCARWPTRCTIHLDRRLTRGETLEKAVAQIEALESVKQAGATVTVLDYARASYTGLDVPDEEVLPDVGARRDGARRARRRWRRPPRRSAARPSWTSGRSRPTASRRAACSACRRSGFGPANEVHAHTPDDQCPVEHLTPRGAVLRAVRAEVPGSPPSPVGLRRGRPV